MANLRRHLSGYSFIAPWLVALVLFIGFPFLAGLYFSFCDYPPLKTPVFIGLDNYAELVGDVKFHHSMGVTLLYASAAIPLGVLLAITLAMLLNARVRGQSLYRVIFYIPHLVPTVVVALLWMWIFNPEYGLLNIVLARLFQAADGWTGIFVSLAAAAERQNFFEWPAALLVIAPVLAAISIGPWVPAGLRARPSLHRFMAFAAIVLVVAGSLALVNAALTYADPFDMRKLHAPGWLTDADTVPSFLPYGPSMALWALILMSLWSVGQMAIIYLAKLQDVPGELYEAADIDGANWAQKTWHITIPMISPVILFNVVMAIIGTFQVFAEPYIMTAGGPEDKTRFVAMFVYDNAFLYQRVGYASAVAWVLFIMIVVLTLLAFRLSQKRVYYAGR